MSPPGTSGTLKIDGDVTGNNDMQSARIGNPVLSTTRGKPSYTGGEVNDNYAYLDTTFDTFAAASGVTAPALLATLGIFPSGTGHESDRIWVRNYGELARTMHRIFTVAPNSATG